MVVTSLPSLGQGETGSNFSNFKHKLHKKNCNRIVFFAITFRRIRTFYSYKNLQLIYTLQQAYTNLHSRTSVFCAYALTLFISILNL